MMGYTYSNWFLSGGKQGTEPPESLKLLKKAVQLYFQGSELPLAKRAGLGMQIFKLHADQVWTIGVVGMGLESYGLYCNTNRLANVPARIVNTQQTNNTTLALPQTFHYS
jgi:peptide/nickel transport system substrate-binding protein